MTPIQQALAGTRDSIRYVADDIANSRRRSAQADLQGAQLQSENAYRMANLGLRNKELDIRQANLNETIKANKPVKVRDLITLAYGQNPDLVNKVGASFEASRPGFLDSEISPALASKAFQSISDQFKTTRRLSPEEAQKAGFPKGAVVEQDGFGKTNVVYTPKNTNLSSMLTADQTKSLGLEEGTVAQMDGKGNVRILQRPGKSAGQVSSKDSEQIRTELIRQASPIITAVAEARGVLPEDVQKNPELYFSEEGLGMFSAMQEVAFALKQQNPKTSYTKAAREAKKIVEDSAGAKFVEHYKSLDPGQRKRFVDEFKVSSPYAFGIFKEAAARADKEEVAARAKAKNKPAPRQMDVAASHATTTPVATQPPPQPEAYEPASYKGRALGDAIMKKAKGANKFLLNLKSHSRENPTFKPLF